MKLFISILLLSLTSICNAQYNKEKLTGILTDGKEKMWYVSSTTVAAEEKTMSFNVNSAVTIQLTSGKIINDKWQLSSDDKIRWFIVTGKIKYELIVSYDKKGKEYLKLKRQTPKPGTMGDYEIKLTSEK